MIDFISQKIIQTQLNLSDIFGPDMPWKITPIPDGNPEDLALTYLRNILVLVFIGLVIVWMVMSVISGYRFITAAGDADKQKAAMMTLKNLFMGIGLSVVVVLAVIMILSTFTKA